VQGLDDFAVRLPPVGAAMRHPPQVDDVADQVQPFAAQLREEPRQLGGMAMT
jgi:hypothetical protein